MRNALFVLITLAFTTFFPTSKIIANVQDNNTEFCIDRDMILSHAQKEFMVTDKHISNIFTYYKCGDTENDNFDIQENTNKKNFAVISPLTIYNSKSLTSVSKLHYNKYYGNPYATLAQLPIYILNNSLLIPFS